MVSPELLEILVCPENHSRLSVADSALERINTAIADRLIKNNVGDVLEAPLSGGLIRADGQVLYPVVDGIPNMLADRAIRLDQIAEPSGRGNDGGFFPSD
jgi:uncharacterized protein YbaR (Trm112 family)